MDEPSARPGNEIKPGAVPWLVYSALAYVIFLGAMAYLVGFLIDAAVPKTIDTGTAGGGAAAVIDVALLAVFALQHSVMARPWFKARLHRWVPDFAERSTFVFASNGALILLIIGWQPLPGNLWTVSSPVLSTLIVLVFFVGVGTATWATFMIDHFDFVGLRQPWRHARGGDAPENPFTQRALYRFVRHPIMLGFLIAFWVTPHMTVGHLLFAAGATAYMGLGVWLEERSLVRSLGQEYEDYRARVPAIVPLRFHSR